MLTQEQLQLRSRGIGASETAALMGLDKYRGPSAIWARKMGITQDAESYHVKRGNFLEPALRSWASDSIGIDFVPCASTLTSPTHPLVLATPDGIHASVRLPGDVVGVDSTLELKAPGRRTEHEWGDTDAPDRYVVQVVQQMLVTDACQGFLAALVDGDLRVYPVARDAELEGVIIETIERFWRDHIVTGVPPPEDGSEASREILLKRFPRILRPELVTASNGDEELIAQLVDEREAVKRHEAQVDLLTQRVQAKIGDAKGIQWPGGKAQWVEVKGRETIDTKALREAQPEVAKQFTRVGAPSRQFRLTLNKE